MPYEEEIIGKPENIFKSNVKTTYQSLCTVSTLLFRKSILFNFYIRKEKIFKVNKWSFYGKRQGNVGQIKTK